VFMYLCSCACVCVVGVCLWGMGAKVCGVRCGRDVWMCVWMCVGVCGCDGCVCKCV
jgi:hypothetical protein